jgi:hypothetical protein
MDRGVWKEEAGAIARMRIVELRRDAIPFDEIGRRLWEAGEWPTDPGKTGHAPSKQSVWEQWRRALRAIPAPAMAELRAERSEQLAELMRRAQEVMDRDHVAHSNGVVVHDPTTGKPLVDDAPKLAAIREARMIHAQLSVLMGENAPTQQKVTMDATVEYSVVGVDPEALK